MIINALGKPCPIPVVEAKKALTGQDVSMVVVKVDNIVAVQNLEKMADGYGYGFSHVENSVDSFEVTICKSGSASAVIESSDSDKTPNAGSDSEVFSASEGDKGYVKKLAIVVGSDTMGKGSEELGKILIKGFLYSLTELPVPPKHVIFLNSGAYLTSDGANTIDDLKKLEDKGTEIVTCGTCINYYELQDKLAVGKIVNMYEITERLAGSDSVVNI